MHRHLLLEPPTAGVTREWPELPAPAWESYGPSRSWKLRPLLARSPLPVAGYKGQDVGAGCSDHHQPPSIVVDWPSLEIRHGNLPHWACQGATYHVSFRIETYLDAGHGACWLKQPEIAALVADALRYFDGQRYGLHAWCVMPNHTHVVVQPLPGYSLATIIHSWKSYTATVANRRLRRSGPFWQHEPYDHIIRSAKEYSFQVDYVWRNPEKAGLRAPRWKVAGASSSGFAA